MEATTTNSEDASEDEYEYVEEEEETFELDDEEGDYEVAGISVEDELGLGDS